jgi:hypothetical protein
VVTTRLSSDALGVLLGVLAGVGASIPCALILMAVTRRRSEDADPADLDEDDPYPRRETYDPRRTAPPVYIITPNQSTPQQLPPWTSSQPGWRPTWEQTNPMQARRSFRVMGYDEKEG